MKIGNSPLLAIQRAGLGNGANQKKGAGLARLLMVLGLLLLASPAMALGAPPEGYGAPSFADSVDPARVAAVIRFYTDRNERLDNSHSESYRAMAAYLSEGPLSGEFGSATDPARLAAVLRFYTDPYEGGDSARDPQSLALTKVLGGFKPSRAAVEALACTDNGIPDQLCSAETFGGTP